LTTRMDLGAESRVLVDLRAAGPLRAVGHSPTLVAYPESASIVFPEEYGGPAPSGAREAHEAPMLEVPVRVRFAANRIAPPDDLNATDREKMRENLLGRDVLDEPRFSMIEYAGRYAGTLEGGTLGGELNIRGKAHPVEMDVLLSRNGDKIIAKCTWEGTLTSLGIKPYRALFGALRLEDWVRLRVEACLASPAKSEPKIR
jgi:hypothetical protein